ncbi:MAG: hypothetical protein J0H30_01045, partial [Alphaproteobacteria bacterium]|nr:hypothetical protein [Alphaproteobacteria bacterium]
MRIPLSSLIWSQHKGIGEPSSSGRYDVCIRPQFHLAEDPVAAGMLCRIEAGIGALDQGLCCFIRGELRHADGDGDCAKNIAGRFLDQLL